MSTSSISALVHVGPWTVPLTPVQSTNVAAIGYVADACLLVVRFTAGGTYVYHGVPARVASELARAPSKGRYLAQHIARNRAYQYERLPETSNG